MDNKQIYLYYIYYIYIIISLYLYLYHLYLYVSTLLSLGVAVLICHSCHLAVHRDFDDTMADFRVSPTQSATKARISKGECPNADASMFIAHHEEKI